MSCNCRYCETTQEEADYFADDICESHEFELIQVGGSPGEPVEYDCVCKHCGTVKECD
jgi:hypothetical protein